MLDLPTLGRELRTIRRGLRIPSAELARRIGVSQTYIWLIEQAKPRTSGEPSRPSEDLLHRWTAALGMSADEAQRIRELAGYFGPDLTRERGGIPVASPRPSSQPPSPAEQALRVDADERDRMYDSQSQSDRRVANLAALRRWSGTDEIGGGDEAIAARIRDVLEQADRSGRSEEVRALLNSFLSWLDFRTKAEG